jgi:hypothetical protein
MTGEVPFEIRLVCAHVFQRDDRRPQSRCAAIHHERETVRQTLEDAFEVDGLVIVIGWFFFRLS